MTWTAVGGVKLGTQRIEVIGCFAFAWGIVIAT